MVGFVCGVPTNCGGSSSVNALACTHNPTASRQTKPGGQCRLALQVTWAPSGRSNDGVQLETIATGQSQRSECPRRTKTAPFELEHRAALWRCPELLEAQFGSTRVV